MASLYRSELKLLKDLTSYAIRKKWTIVPITLLGVASSIIELAAMASIIPLSILAGGTAIPTASQWHKLPSVFGLPADAKFYALLFLGLMLLRALTFAASQMLNQYTMRTLIAHFSFRALDSFVRSLSFKEVQKHQVGHFLTLAGDEANRGAQIILALMKLVPFTVLFALYVGILFYQSWQVGAGLFGFLALVLVLLTDAFRTSHRLGQRQQEQSRALNTHFIESLSGLRTVRSFTAEGFVSSRYKQMITEYVWTCFKVDALNTMAANAPTILLMSVFIISASVFVDSTWLAASMPALLAGAVMILRLLPLANQALDVALKLTADLKAARNISDVLQAVSADDSALYRDMDTQDEPIERIEFKNVSFRYSSDTPNVLDTFNLKLEKGKSYAITGPSGSGKSSLIDLLLKFFTPDSGTIRINGKDAATISDLSLRKRIVLAEQTIRIFYDTILQNLGFGQTFPREKAMAIMNTVGLTSLLKSLPDGIDTLMDYQGSNFSGGQRQRIGLARAMLRSADVLILDESTNALDLSLRELIIDNLLSEYADRIVIFVTHDSYVMERVDEVIHLNASNVAAQTSPVMATP